MSTDQYLSMGLMAVGALAGALAFGGKGITVGMAIGGIAGGMLGSYLFGGDNSRNTSPPDLQENRVQISTYGNMITMLWGAKRLAGNIIWMDEVKEQYHSQEYETHLHDGIGGGVGDEDIKWYVRSRTYTCSFAVAFCEGEVDSVIRLWVNNELLVDFRDPDGAAYPPGAGALTAATNVDRSSVLANQRYALYYGSEDQAADATIAAVEGAAYTPAYRGICYIVFKDFPVGAYSGIPTIEAEIVKTGSSRSEAAVLDLNATVPFDTHSRTWSTTSNPWTQQGNYLAVYPGYLVSNQYVFPPQLIMFNKFTASIVDQMDLLLPSTDTSPFYYLGFIGWGVDMVSGQLHISTALYHTSYYYVRREMVYSEPFGELIYDGESVGRINLSQPGYFLQQFWAGGQKFCTFNTLADGGAAHYGLLKVTDPPYGFGATGFQQIVVTRSDASTVSVDPYYVRWSSDGTYVYMTNYSTPIQYVPGVAQYAVLRIDPAQMTFSGNNVNIAYGGWEIIRTDGNSHFPASFVANSTTFPSTHYHETLGALGEVAMLSDPSNTDPAYRVYQDKVNATLEDAVTEICERAGITADIDAADLDDDVRGYAITRQMPAATALQPLMAAFAFDAAEIDWGLHFVPRGQGYLVSIGNDDLGAVEAGERRADNLVETRVQDVELPTHLEVNYESEGRDYDIGTQRAVRVDKASYSQMAVNLPIVLSEAQAKQQAEVMLQALWLARTKYRFATTHKYNYLAPGNVVRVGGRDMRILSFQDRRGQLVFEAEAEGDSTQYVSEAQADDIRYIAPTLDDGTNATTRFEALDLPLIDADDAALGFYYALYAYAAGYVGGGLLQSVDAGASFDELDFQIGDTATVGRCLSALDAGVENVLNRDAELTVSLAVTGGSFASRPDPDTDGSTNLLAVGTTAGGWEVIQFATATDEGDGVWTLSGLLRGLYGTQDMMDGHSVDDLVIPLVNHTELRRIGQSAAMLDVATLLAASTYTGMAGSPVGESKSFTNTFYGAKPYPVSGIVAGRNAGGDIIITWRRGDRLFFTVDELADSEDVPMSEASEAYEIDIVDNSTEALYRTIEASDSTCTYTAAEQAADGSGSAELRAEIYQMSAAIGRGRMASQVL